jgi:hypothetical protein
MPVSSPVSHPGGLGLKIQEFNFAAKSHVPKEGPEGRKTLQGTCEPKKPPPRPRLSRREDESKGSSPYRHPEWDGECRAGIQRWRVTAHPSPFSSRAILALQVHSRPLLGPSVETAFRPKFCPLRL